jgi:hypothetical protein
VTNASVKIGRAGGGDGAGAGVGGGGGAGVGAGGYRGCWVLIFLLRVF